MKGWSAETARDARAESRSTPASPWPSHQPLPNRTKVSCFPCRTRKSKCDHARPCSSCVLRGTASQCADPNAAAPTAKSSSEAAAAAAVVAAGSGSGTVTPTAMAQSRSLPVSISMPSLADTGLDSESRLNGGSQSKRRRTEAVPCSSRSHSSSLTAAVGNPDHEISQEMHRIRQTLSRLEELLHRRFPPPALLPSSPPSSTSTTHEYNLDPTQDLPGESGPPCLESRTRWHHLRTLLPPLIDTHLMTHYLYVEADWLMTCVEASRFVARWKHVYTTESIAQVFAVQVLTLVACSALFLSDNHKRTIQFAVPIRSLHTKLIKEAISMVDSMPALHSAGSEAERCDMIQLMLNISFYFRCLGKNALMARYTERAVSCSMIAEFDNELRPSWLGLSEQQVERRRLLMMETAMSAKWLAFHCRKEKAHLPVLSFNLGQAHMRHVGQLPPLSAWPQSDQLVARIVAAQSQKPLQDGPQGTARFFASRTKSDFERHLVRTYHRISCSISNELPSIVQLASKTEAKLLNPESLAKVTKEEMREMARSTRSILARLEQWHTILLPRVGVGFDRILNAEVTSADPVKGKEMATLLMLNHANFYMTSILCRAWLLLSDRLQSLHDAAKEEASEYNHPSTMVNQNFLAHLKQHSMDHVQQTHVAWLPSTFLAEMEAAALENVQRCIRSIPLIRTLQAQSSSHFYAGWTCQACLQAAVNLAIPLIRSYRRQSQGFRETLFAGVGTDVLRRDMITIFGAVSQLSDHIAARRTARIMNKAMPSTGIDLAPSASQIIRGFTRWGGEEEFEDAWEMEELQTQQQQEGAGQMQNAAEGLALLSAASASVSSATSPNSNASHTSPVGMAWDANTARASNYSASNLNWHSHLVPFNREPYPPTCTAAGVADEPTTSEPMWWEARLPSSFQKMPTSAAAAGVRSATSGAGTGQIPMSDSQLLDELLNFDPSFWQFVLDGSPNSAAAASA
ncbi:hypothetical protein NDA18_004793 [Ustilago nuda]|nr:hypothetical protein NDA18_004793 [Ustilago nuda]